MRENKRFYDIYDLWINPDPYKHRAMRMCGIAEKFITGDASNEEKFLKWCEIIPKLIGNPLWIWSHMELSFVFGIDGNLNFEAGLFVDNIPVNLRNESAKYMAKVGKYLIERYWSYKNRFE